MRSKNESKKVCGSKPSIKRLQTMDLDDKVVVIAQVLKVTKELQALHDLLLKL